jgi:hypothetical protein
MIDALSKSFDIGTFLAGITKLITATLGPIFAGMTANLAPTQGLAAPAEAAGITAAVGATATGMSKLETGAWKIPGVMAAQLHPGEMVVPAGPAAALRSFAEGQANAGSSGGGGVTHNWNISAIDGPSVQRFVNQHSDKIARAVASAQPRNPSLGWSKT